MNTEQLKKKAAQIRLVALDVDGVLTDGTITYLSSGEEVKSFNVKDGLGIVRLAAAGFKTAIISIRKSKVVEIRAKELKIDHLYQGVKDKQAVIERLAKSHHYEFSQIAYMGDDIVDLPTMRIVGLSACPQDAISEVLSTAHFISSKPGGRGAVREFCELIMQAQGGS